MSFEPDDIEHEMDVKELLGVIAEQLILLNARFEEAFNTKIDEKDIV